MIFVTIGTQVPFDRFVRIIDNLATRLDEEIIVQTSTASNYKTVNVKTVEFLPPDEFNELFAQARLIVSHAGMGTILSAMQLSKPIVIFPRDVSLHEHRNNHQMATARRMEELGYVYVAYTADDIERLLLHTDLKVLHHLGDTAQKSLTDRLSEIIEHS